MDKSDQNVRCDVLFSGRVQGVGFRYTARQIAGRFSVTGYVRNLTDGRVRLVVEGAEPEVEQYLAAVVAEMAHHVRDQEAQKEPATGEFTGFEVRQ